MTPDRQKHGKKPFDKERLAECWSRFYDNNPRLVRQLIEELLKENPDLTPAKMFGIISFGRGCPGTHCSGKMGEDEKEPKIKEWKGKGRRRRPGR